jgi:gamma-glutamyltranspeptidase / glutathione hydrolase
MIMNRAVETRTRPSRPDPASVSAIARNAMISTSHPLATEAGLTALRGGGSAVDAYLAAAAVQTVVEPTMTSLGGSLAMSVYEPSTRRSRIVAAMCSLPAAEQGGALDDDAYWSGRTVTAPGWVSAAHAAWKKWGKLKWADVWSDALTCARDGFIVDQLLWGTMWEYRTVPGIYAHGRDVWFPGGRLVCVGEPLRQPALARTIEQLAEQGPRFFHQGEFARRYVETARAAGGRLTLDDMAAAQQKTFDVELPVLPLANGYELHTNGLMYALALNLASIGGLGRRGRPSEDAQSLFLLMRIVEETWHHCLSLADGSGFGVEALERTAGAVSPEQSEKLWPRVEAGPPRSFDGMNMDTNAIVVVDGSGMVVHGTHSTSGTPFGVGLMVDGVILTRPLYHFARPIVTMPVGWGTSLLALRHGRPVFAAGSPSISAVQNVLQNTMNVLEWGMEPGESVQQPMFGSPLYPSKRPMVEATMGEAVIAEVERRGLEVDRVSPWEQEMGSCHAVHISEDGTLRGAADPRRLGRAAGY